MKRRNGLRAFTLIEIMVVVLIIGLLLAIGIPSYIRAKNDSRRTTCIENLRIIESAKEHWAIDNKRITGDPVALADLMASYIRLGPVCPSGGTYTPQPIGTPPTCTFGGDHHLP